MPFVIDDLLIAAGIAAATGTANAISDGTAASQQQDNINAYIKEISKNRIDNEELDKLLLANKRLFNNKLVSVLNTAALKTNNIANQNVVAGSLASNITASAVESELNLRYRVEDNNKNVTTQIASAKLGQISADPVGSFFTGAIPGFTAGLEAIKYVNNSSGTTGPGKASPTLPPVTPFQGVTPGSLPLSTPESNYTPNTYFNNVDKTGIFDFDHNPFEPGHNRYYNFLNGTQGYNQLGGF